MARHRNRKRREPPDKASTLLEDSRDEISKLIQWIAGDEGSLDNAMQERLDRVLKDYPTKMRLLAYLFAMKQMITLADARQTQQLLIEEVLENSAYVSHKTKIQLISVLGDSIATGMERIQTLAGLSEAPEHILTSLLGQSRSASDLSKSTPEEREHIRQKLAPFLEELAARVKT